MYLKSQPTHKSFVKLHNKAIAEGEGQKVEKAVKALAKKLEGEGEGKGQKSGRRRRKAKAKAIHIQPEPR